jgi:hypothetical protein
VLWFGRTNTPGAKATLNAVRCLSMPGLEVVHNGLCLPSGVVDWLQANRHIRILNVAGNRESREPGIGVRVEQFLAAVLRRVGHEAAEPGD